MSGIKFGVLTISDTCAKNSKLDKSGPKLVELTRNNFKLSQVRSIIVPDEYRAIQKSLFEFIDEQVNVIFTTGGTGFGPRDITPEVTKSVITRDCPQLTLTLALASLQKTKFAALSRGICGISGETLILNFPGSEKAVVECFEAVQDLLPHAVELISNNLEKVRNVHVPPQSKTPEKYASHVCSHRTDCGDGNDRNSPFPMIPVAEALKLIFEIINVKTERQQFLDEFLSPLDIPPFRASIKDGYAMKSSGFSGTKKVLGCIGAGDEINTTPLMEDECFKINTGAPVPLHADSVVQVEDTKLLRRKKGTNEEDLVEILTDPKLNLDIRPIGCDLTKNTKLFPCNDCSDVIIKSVLASVGQAIPKPLQKPTIVVISTGNELLMPQQPNNPYKIYDSNSTMLEELLKYFGFNCIYKTILNDELSSVESNIEKFLDMADFIICSGGVSMGDKDYIKPVLEKIGFRIHFGRVNMKPGKPMTFASRNGKYFFGLPGNPVSAFVTFHIFVLPAIRWADGWNRDKCELPCIQVKLINDEIKLDPRPEYMRAAVTSSNGELFALADQNQMSSRLQSIVGADVLLHCPGRSDSKKSLLAGEELKAYVIRYDFISRYE